MHGMAPVEVAAMQDCFELLGDLVYELKNSLESTSFQRFTASHQQHTNMGQLLGSEGSALNLNREVHLRVS